MKTKKLFLFGISIMLVVLALQGVNNSREGFLSNAWGACSGPCKTGEPCGLGNSSVGTCDPYDFCNGTCTSTCAKGANDKFCLGISGSCTISMVNCSPIKKYRCEATGDHCYCYNYGTAGYCSRQTC